VSSGIDVLLDYVDEMTANDKIGDARTATSGELLCGLSATDHEALGHFATTAGTSMSVTRSCHPGRKICSITSDRSTKYKCTDRSGRTFIRLDLWQSGKDLLTFSTNGGVETMLVTEQVFHSHCSIFSVAFSALYCMQTVYNSILGSVVQKDALWLARKAARVAEVREGMRRWKLFFLLHLA
jgi:hypothetical protein